MTISFILIAVITIGATVAAMTLRNLVHCALALTIGFAGLAAVYLQLDAQFVGFAQVLVYVGAVAILVVFAILLTRGGEVQEGSIFSKSWAVGMAVAVAVLAVLVEAIAKSSVVARQPHAEPAVTVRRIGDAMMREFVLPLEVVGLLLTAALIGAVIIAMRDRPMTGRRTAPPASAADENGNPGQTP